MKLSLKRLFRKDLWSQNDPRYGYFENNCIGARLKVKEKGSIENKREGSQGKSVLGSWVRTEEG